VILLLCFLDPASARGKYARGHGATGCKLSGSAAIEAARCSAREHNRLAWRVNGADLFNFQH
jgi:hypothetical protein